MRKLSESIWSDIQDRSSGDTVRKEDDIEHFNRDEMCDYIFSIYDTNKDINALPVLKSEKMFFSLTVFEYEYSTYRMSVKYINDKISEISLLAEERDCKGFYDKLANNFNLIKKYYGSIEIESKDSTISNRLVIEIIDTINDGIKEANMDNKLKPMLIKKK